MNFLRNVVGVILLLFASIIAILGIVLLYLAQFAIIGLGIGLVIFIVYEIVRFII